MKLIQISLLVLICATCVLTMYAIYLMTTGNYHSPLCL